MTDPFAAMILQRYPRLARFYGYAATDAANPSASAPNARALVADAGQGGGL